MQTTTQTLIQEARSHGVHVTEHQGHIQIHNILGAGQSPVTGEIAQQELLGKAIDLAKEKSFRNIHLRTSATYYSQEEANILAIWAKNLGHEFKIHQTAPNKQGQIFYAIEINRAIRTRWLTLPPHNETRAAQASRYLQSLLDSYEATTDNESTLDGVPLSEIKEFLRSSE